MGLEQSFEAAAQIGIAAADSVQVSLSLLRSLLLLSDFGVHLPLHGPFSVLYGTVRYVQ
jgi:hypothetical protein